MKTRPSGKQVRVGSNRVGLGRGLPHVLRLPQNVTGYGLHAIYAAINATYVKWKCEASSTHVRGPRTRHDPFRAHSRFRRAAVPRFCYVVYALLIIIVLFCIYLRSSHTTTRRGLSSVGELPPKTSDSRAFNDNKLSQPIGRCPSTPSASSSRIVFLFKGTKQMLRNAPTKEMAHVKIYTNVITFYGVSMRGRGRELCSKLKAILAVEQVSEIIKFRLSIRQFATFPPGSFDDLQLLK